MLRNRLTPRLNDFVAGSLKEIEYTINQEFPLIKGNTTSISSRVCLPHNTDEMSTKIDEWTTVKINNNLLYVVAGVTTRAMSGTLLCRRRQWLSTCIKYTENIFMTVLILRLFPRMFHRWITIFIPSSWVTHLCLRRAKKLLVPIIKQRIKEQAFPSDESEKPLDLLQYMIEDAEGDDLQPERLAHLELMANLAGIHTTSMAITHAIYDLCEHEEYIQVLRDEIEEVLGKVGGWQRDTHRKLRKVDSFLRESQRFSPPTLCASPTLPLLAVGISLTNPRKARTLTISSIIQSHCASATHPLLR